MIKLIGKVKPSRQCFDWDLRWNEIYTTARRTFDSIAKVFDGRKSYALHTAQVLESHIVNLKGNAVKFGAVYFNRIPFTSNVYLGKNIVMGGNVYINAIVPRDDGSWMLLRFVSVNKSNAIPFAVKYMTR